MKLLLAKLRAVFRKEKLDRDMAKKMRFHLDERYRGPDGRRRVTRRSQLRRAAQIRQRRRDSGLRRATFVDPIQTLRSE